MCAYRPRYHLSPERGRLNDPNGVYLEGETLHVYYQHDPAFPYTPKRTGWGHALTRLAGPRALHWEHLPEALEPGAAYDRDGCYSGSAVIQDGQVRLYYTGNVKADGKRQSTQNLATVQSPDSNDGGRHQRYAANPLIDGPAPGFTSHFRDPQVTVDPEQPDQWRMILGAQRNDGTGAAVLYRSTDLDTWEFDDEITFDLTHALPGDAPDTLPGGYMWECPNLVAMTDRDTGERLDILIFCPQGLEPCNVDGVTHYSNVDQCGYLVGTLTGTTFTVLRGFSELDWGHEFYAPQVAAGTSAEPLLLGWMGLPGQDDQPTVEAEGWVHCLTVPRKLSLYSHRLHQELILPVDPSGPATLVHREQLEMEPVDVVVSAPGKDGCQEVFSLSWAPGAGATGDHDGRLTVSRDGDHRVLNCPPGELVVFVDRSAVEITAGDGAVSLALRAFYTGELALDINRRPAATHAH